MSDPALLEILGQASDSHTIQNHLLSIFDNTKLVDFDEKAYDKIMCINSQEGEKVPLDQPVMAQGNVETWLGELLKTSRRSVHSVIRAASVGIGDSGFKLIEFENMYPAQVSCLLLHSSSCLPLPCLILFIILPSCGKVLFHPILFPTVPIQTINSKRECIIALVLNLSTCEMYQQNG